ncbi:MAG: primosomal protein N' [Phycisphaerales bacterium]|nr:primosomal protein N' [Phycisphaerae bacterium]NNM26263.1 primosomal protein N' [Phycisphaerales bacterium]
MPDLFAQPVASYARVAVERGIDRYPDGLVYAVANDLADLVAGERVMVPLGRGDRATAGYVIEVDAEPGRHVSAVKFVQRRDDAASRLPPQLVTLARWISQYYATPIGVTLAAMLPAAVKRSVGLVRRVYVDRVADAEEPPRLSPQQRAVLATLDGLPADRRPIEIKSLAAEAGLRSVSPIRRLAQRGLLTTIQRTGVDAAWADHAVDAAPPPTLTAAQRQVIDAIDAAGTDAFSAHLLYGVTGAGKTEVYLRLIERTLARGKSALLLVPEISLTPQTGGRLLGRFPDVTVAILHSGLTAAQRHQQWTLAAHGAASIVVGARSAVFAPVPDGTLGLIVVDEEHDGSYKQDQAPRYHGRDVALRRGQLAGCPVVLGSATPALESWHNATMRKTAQLHRLDDRAPGLRLPRVEVVDLAAERRMRPGKHLLGPTLEDALRDTLDAGAQALLLLNRRGYANYIACPSSGCGWVMHCEGCDVCMVYHRDRRLPAGGFVRCHHCQREQRLPRACPDCGRGIATLGLGTQRVEEELRAKFPVLAEGDTLARLDSDTVRSARGLHDVLERFGAGIVRVLLGTQMIAKGLDYPGVRLVGVVNADTAINLPDFRATERTFQLVSQVTGRCGRAEGPRRDRAIVQSFHPDNHAIQMAAAHDYPAFAAAELEDRRLCGLPPFTRMARIVVRHRDHPRCVALAHALAEGLTPLVPPSVRMDGPAPCPIPRLSDHHRQEVQLIAPSAAELQRVLAAARNAGVLTPGAEMAIDVDPVAVL